MDVVYTFGRRCSWVAVGTRSLNLRDCSVLPRGRSMHQKKYVVPYVGYDNSKENNCLRLGRKVKLEVNVPLLYNTCVEY